MPVVTVLVLPSFTLIMASDASSGAATVPFPAVYAPNREPLSQNQSENHIAGEHVGKLRPAASFLPTGHVLGEPDISLDANEVQAFLSKELSTPLLDDLHDNLWFVARRSYNNIDALHRHLIKGRKITISEDCKLHMIWDRNRFFVKPVPLCLMNHDFWMQFLTGSAKAQGSPSIIHIEESTPEDRLRSLAVGFLRSYAFLIQHRSDFAIAQSHNLLPTDYDWLQWSKFICHFRYLDDAMVARRYHYGQLRLSRLNWATRIFRPSNSSTSWFYELPYWSTMPYIEAAAAPLLFIFASFSLVLSSMQVMLAAPKDVLAFPGFGHQEERTVARVYWAFSICVILLSWLSWILLAAVPTTAIMWQLSFGYRKGKLQSHE